MNAPSAGGEQLALDLMLRDGSSFANFVVAGNRELFDLLTAAAHDLGGFRARGAMVLCLWGEVGSGKTHLLEALCRTTHERGLSPIYVSLLDRSQLSTALFEDIEGAPLVCIDDLDSIVGDARWESAVFGVYERLRTSGGVMVVAASGNPASLGLAMPDLATRLAAGLVYQVRALNDADKVTALCVRARNRGIDMPEEVAHYVLERHPRDMHALFGLLTRIDRLALATQRRITIPLVRRLENQDKG